MATYTFLENPRFPDDIAFWGQGGPKYNTIVNTSTSGREKRNSLWYYALSTWRINNVSRTVAVPVQYNIATIRNFFRAMKGQAWGFRFRDWADYQDEGQGIVGQQFSSFSNSNFVPVGAGTGYPTTQMYKVYAETPFYDYRVIQKPYNGGGLNVQRNGANVVQGTGAGQCVIDTTTGNVNWTADQSATVTGATAGATTQVTLSAALSLAVVGKLLYLNVTGGTLGAALTGQAWQITAVSGTTYTLAANTTGLTGTVTGTAGMYPQPSDVLQWTGMFDVPCRFNTDFFDLAFNSGGLADLNLEIMEIRI